MSTIESLVRLMPPGGDAGTAVDWAEVESAWGRRFPSDYRSFVAAYGEGTIGNYLAVLVPEADGGDPAGPMEFISEDARGTWAETDSARPADLHIRVDDIIAWGSDATGDLLCWAAGPENPDEWTVLVYNRGDDCWAEFGCGMVEFLCRVFLADFADFADFAESPLSGEVLWGDSHPRFLTEIEMSRLRRAGVDPWS